MKTLHIEVFGVVQGVSFRAFTQTIAQKLGVCGIVRNTFHGSVDILATANSGILSEFVTQLKIGPPSSKVAAVQATEISVTHFKGFSLGTAIK